jgi:pyruvate ferredoxin oxidoreductase alpha subunit
MRVFRPFPVAELIKVAGEVSVLGVLDKAASLGAPGGPIYEEVKTAFYDEARRPLIADYIHGLGGRDTSPNQIKSIFKSLLEIGREGNVADKVSYVGVRQ